MASLLRVRCDGIIEGVYDDRLRGLVEALSGRPLGAQDVCRASEVEMDADGQWVARLVGTGEIIARRRSRSEVISEEVNWLEKNVITQQRKETR